MSIVDTVFDITRYMPHGYCLLWQPELVWMHILSDVVITVAYFSIPGAIAFLLYKRKQAVPFRWVFLSFSLFIVFCGITHLVSIIVLWYPTYYLQGIIKTATAIISIATAVLLFPLLPLLLEIFAGLNEEEEEEKYNEASQQA